MQMIILLALGLILSLGAPETAPAWRLSPAALAGGVVGYLLGTGVLTWAVTRWGLWRLMAAGDPPEQVSRRHRRFMLLVRGWLLAGIAVIVLGGLPHQLRDLTALGRVGLLADAVAAGVFFLACLLYWRLGFRFDQAIRWQVEQDLMLAGQPVRPSWNLRQYMDFNIRHQFLFIAVPISLIVIARDVLLWVVPMVVPLEAQGWAGLGAMVLAVGGVFFLSPLLLVRIWRTRPLPRGELRSRLERLCGQIGLRYRDILIWDTHGVLVNAGMMGLRPWVRYILISDALLEQMEDRQIVAVFGHEAGHVVHHHIAYFLLFTVSALLLTGSVVAGLGLLLPLGVWGEQALLLVLVAATWGLGFGWLSRQFERQADVFGAWSAGVDAREHGQGDPSADAFTLGAATFAAALENVARLNGTSRRTRNWRHGAIATRVGFLMTWVGMGGTRQSFDRTVGLLKLAAWCILAAGAMGVVLTWSAWA